MSGQADTQQEKACVVCGTSEKSEKGWIYQFSDVQPTGIEDGTMRWEPKEDASPLCSIDCKKEFKEGAGDE